MPRIHDEWGIRLSEYPDVEDSKKDMSKRQELEKEAANDKPEGPEYVTRKSLDDIFKNLAFPINKRKAPNTTAIQVSTDMVYVETNHGKQVARKGDYIVKGIDNQYFAVPKSVFEKTYYMVKE